MKQIVIITICLLFITGLFLFLPTNYADWIDHLHPAALAGWRDVDRFYVYNPPWTLLPLYPLALLPPRLGASLLGLLTLAILAVYLRSTRKLLCVATSAPLVLTITQGNIDALPLLGLLAPDGARGLVPPWLALPLLAIKPQGVWLASLRRLNCRALVVLGILVGLSLLIWGPGWLWAWSGSLSSSSHNLSLFPYSLPLVPLLVWRGLKTRRDSLLCLASLCLSPYWMITSVLPAVAAGTRESDDWRVWLAVSLASWAFLLISR